MRKTQIFIIGILALAIGIVIGGWLRSSQTSTNIAHAKSATQTARVNQQEKNLFAMNVIVSGVPFWTDARETWAKIGDTVEGVKTVFGGPTDTDAAKQIEEIDNLIAQKVRGIVIRPCDPATLGPEIDKAVAAGIPVVTMLADVPNSKRLCYVTSELEDAGKRVGNYVAKNAGYKGKAIISIGELVDDEQLRRGDGFKQVIAANPGMELVQVVEDKFDDTKGAEAIHAALVKTPDIKFIFGCDSRSAVAAVTALKEMGKKPGDVIVSAWDYDVDVLNLIKEGWVQASAASESSYMTQLCFSLLQAYDKGYLYPQSLPYKKFDVSPAPSKIVVPITLVTPKNVDVYSRTPKK